MTDLRGLLTDDDAVSPVIGVVLMVAVTVILSAAVGAFVLDIGSAVTKERPTVAFQFQSNVSGGSPDAVNITHVGGDTVESSKLGVVIDGKLAWQGSPEGAYRVVSSDWTGDIASGESLVIVDNKSKGANTESGDLVQVVWRDGRQSSVLGEWRVQ